MKHRRSYPYFILSTAAVLAFSGAAFADGGPARLPESLNDWSDASAEIDLAEAPIISLSEFPQGRMSTQKPSFIDFDHWEIGAFAGLADFSSDFKANADWVAGIRTRVPVPAIPLGDWGIWAQASIGHIRRDLPFYYPNRDGNWYGFAAGGDYTFAKGEIAYLRGQVGIMYAYWNNINALDNGFGILVGAELGFFWIKHYDKAMFTITPQMNYDGTNWILLVTAGFSYDF